MLGDTCKLSCFSYVVKILSLCSIFENDFGACAHSIVCSIKYAFISPVHNLF